MKKPLVVQVDPVRAAADPKGAVLDALVERIQEAIVRWDERDGGAALKGADKAMAIARALHGVTITWPFCHACLGLLLDEERNDALAHFHLKGGRA